VFGNKKDKEDIIGLWNSSRNHSIQIRNLEQSIIEIQNILNEVGIKTNEITMIAQNEINQLKENNSKIIIPEIEALAQKVNSRTINYETLDNITKRLTKIETDYSLLIDKINQPKQSIETPHEEIEDFVIPDIEKPQQSIEPVLIKEEAKTVCQLKKQLTPHQQRIFDLKESGLNQKQIAEQLNVSAQAISNAMKYIRKKRILLT